MRRFSKRYTKHWWLKPAVRNATSPCGIPTVSARNACVSRTLWHTPIVRSDGHSEPAQIPQGTIAIGFV